MSLLENALRFALGIFSGKLFFIGAPETTAVVSGALFHEKGRNGEQHHLLEHRGGRFFGASNPAADSVICCWTSRKPAAVCPIHPFSRHGPHPVKTQDRTARRLSGIALIKIILPLNMARAKRKPLNGFAFRLQIGIQCSHLIGFAAEMAGHDLAAGQTDHVR